MDRDVRRPRLATNLAAPRSLAVEEMAQATREGQELRSHLDRVTLAMEAVQPADDRIRLR